MFSAFQSASAAERLARARQFIAELPPATEVAIIAHPRSSADDFVRSFAVKRQATVGLHRFSIGQFALQVSRAEMARRGLAPLTAAGGAALAVRSSSRYALCADSNSSARLRTSQGLRAPSRAHSANCGLRESGLKNSKGLGERGEDLSALLGEYCKQLEAGKLADIFDVFAIATEQVALPDLTLGRNPILLLDVPIASLTEQKFLAALKVQSPAVLATIPDGDERSISAFRAIADEYLADSATATTSLDRVQHYVFGPTPESSYKEDGKVQFFSAPGEGRECVEIARRIQAAAKYGMAFDQIGVALRSPQTLLQETASDYYEQYAPAIERVWRDEVESLRSDLRGWLTQAAERPDGYVPDLIEFAFGLPPDQGRDPASTSDEAIPEGFLLRGVVDLSEKGEHGEIRLTDHKTGKNRTDHGRDPAHPAGDSGQHLEVWRRRSEDEGLCDGSARG